MKKYFISKGNEKKGPFLMSEIQKMELTDKYSIWAEGFDDWIKVTEIEELKQFIIISPPPTPNQLKSIRKKKSFISSLKISLLWLIVLALIIFAIMGGFMDPYDIKKRYGYGEYKIYGSGEYIRETLIRMSVLFSSIISIIILFFNYKSKVKK